MEQIPLPWQQANLDDKKIEYARLLYSRADSPVERVNVARQLYPDQSHVAFALQIADDWRYDPVVVKELDRLGRAGDQDLPDADKIARDVYNLASDASRSIDDRLKAYKLYAEMKGMITKGGTTINNNLNQDNRKVMVVPADMALDQFEAMAESQQAQLVADAGS